MHNTSSARNSIGDQGRRRVRNPKIYFAYCRLNCKNEFVASSSFHFFFRSITSPLTGSRRRMPTDGASPPAVPCTVPAAHRTGRLRPAWPQRTAPGRADLAANDHHRQHGRRIISAPRMAATRHRPRPAWPPPPPRRANRAVPTAALAAALQRTASRVEPPPTASLTALLREPPLAAPAPPRP